MDGWGTLLHRQTFSVSENAFTGCWMIRARPKSGDTEAATMHPSQNHIRGGNRGVNTKIIVKPKPSRCQPHSDIRLPRQPPLRPPSHNYNDNRDVNQPPQSQNNNNQQTSKQRHHRHRSKHRHKRKHEHKHHLSQSSRTCDLDHFVSLVTHVTHQHVLRLQVAMNDPVLM